MSDDLTHRHHPTIYRSRYGCWFWCSCGEQSAEYRTTAMAGYAWAAHLAAGETAKGQY